MRIDVAYDGEDGFPSRQPGELVPDASVHKRELTSAERVGKAMRAPAARSVRYSKLVRSGLVCFAHLQRTSGKLAVVGQNNLFVPVGGK